MLLRHGAHDMIEKREEKRRKRRKEVGILNGAEEKIELVHKSLFAEDDDSGLCLDMSG